MPYRCGIFALMMAFALGLFAISPGVAQVKPPANFTFEKGKDSPGPVTFSHEQHKVGKTVFTVDGSCEKCHKN
jgi:hypothetical protein